MSDYVDLHCHYLPGVDDGARTAEQAEQICAQLKRLGFDTVIATPHVRTALFENSARALKEAYRRFLDQADSASLPRTGLAAEYFCDDVFWSLYEKGEVLRYPGERALLLELPAVIAPVYLQERLFRMVVQGVRPLLAHPERHRLTVRTTEAIEGILRAGALAVLDLMSVSGKHGNGPRRAAERMLQEGVYYAACTDAHHHDDAQWIERGIERLHELVGEEEAHLLLADNPREIVRDAVR